MRPVQLSEYAQLFRDEHSYSEFVRLFSASLDDDEVQVVFAGSQLLCTVMGPDAVREIMQQRILKRFAEQPDLLDELRDRLGDDYLVD